MTDPFILVAIAFASLCAGIYLGIFHSADAQTSPKPRLWWDKATFRAQQRLAYKAFCERERKKYNTNGERIAANIQRDVLLQDTREMVNGI